jgi:hypothetical protein
MGHLSGSFFVLAAEGSALLQLKAVSAGHWPVNEILAKLIP